MNKRKMRFKDFICKDMTFQQLHVQVFCTGSRIPVGRHMPHMLNGMSCQDDLVRKRVGI